MPGMRLGIVSPIVTAHPGAHSEWERSADVNDLVAVAGVADRLGFHHLTCSEHVAVPTAVAAERGATYWDPLATLAFLAASTERIRLATQVLVLGYHHPLVLAKSYGTLDRLSGGRVVLGLGVGSLEEEFALLGQPFQGRGARADDALEALRAAWGRRQPTYQGTHYEFGDVVVEPVALHEQVPIWIGGRSRRSLRRALEHGTGWVPFALGLDEISAMLVDADAPAGFEVVLSAGRPVDPETEPSRVLERLLRVRETGATVISVSVAARSADHYVEQLHALSELAATEPTLSDAFEDNRPHGTP